MRSIHINAGIGGLSQLLGTKVTAYQESDEYASQVLKVRYNVPVHASLDDLPQCDMIIANLDGEVASKLVRRRPPYLFLQHRATFRKSDECKGLLHSLVAEGYDVTWTMLSAANVGAPHRRMRWFCLAHLSNPKRPLRCLLDSVELPRNGTIVRGRYRQCKGPILKDHQLALPIVLRHMKGKKCRGTLQRKRSIFWRWGTPRPCVTRACKNLTVRSMRDLPSQLRYAESTRQKYFCAAPEFLEWLMGFDIGFSNLEQDPVKFQGWNTEQAPRMAPDGYPWLKQRTRIISCETVPQQAKKAYEVLRNRLKRVKQDV